MLGSDLRLLGNQHIPGNPIGLPAYFYNIPSQVHVAGANTVHLDLFNAVPAAGALPRVVRVHSIRQLPNITTAVTGVVFDWALQKTSAVGTGGSAITPWLSDTALDAIAAAITCRSKPTGGATAVAGDLFNYSISSEETNAATIQLATMGGLELIPWPIIPANGGPGLVLRPGEGLRVTQVTNSAAGNTGWIIGITVDPTK